MKERLIYLDYLRILSIAGVVVLHVCAGVLGDQSIFGSANWYTSVAYDSMFRFCVPLFLMISGALLLVPDDKLSVKEFFTRRFSKILIPFLIWSIIYLLHTVGWKVSSLNFSTVFLDFIQRPVFYHLWFVYMLIGVYVFIPFVKYFTKDLNVVLAFVVIWIFIGPARNFIAYFFNVHIGVNLADFPRHAMGYIVLGYYLREVKLSRSYFYIAVAAFVGSYALNYYCLIKYTADKALPFFYLDFTSPGIAVFTASIFYMGRYVFSKEVFANKKAFPIVTTLSNLTFGVYLSHALILDYIFRGDIYVNKFNWNSYPIPGITVTTLYCLVLSFAFCYGISRIKPIKKYFI